VEGRPPKSALLCHPFVCEYQGIEPGRRSINVAALEQSNGFSILGGPPPDARSLGVGGHVRDKDGTLAALLVAEVAAWAKEQGTSIFELIDTHVYLDPDIGLFVNYYEPDPIDGEYPGIEGDRKKMDVLRRALGYFQLALTGDFVLAGHRATSACIYRTGKYDAIYPPTYDFQFPDEGVRFHFGDRFNHVTVRPSGTGNSLRFHIQLRAAVTPANLIDQKQRLMAAARAMADHLRSILQAPRS
jgi:phosphomannomutase